MNEKTRDRLLLCIASFLYTQFSDEMRNSAPADVNEMWNALLTGTAEYQKKYHQSLWQDQRTLEDMYAEET